MQDRRFQKGHRMLATPERSFIKADLRWRIFENAI